MNLTPIFDKDKLKRPFLIAGPCSAESHQQVLQTAQELHATKQIDLFRCGIWKPRSSPNSFEGTGESGLPWLKEIKEQLHLDSCIEIGKPEHLEIALKYDITHFWIGARTSVNPFMVEEIAKSAKNLDISIFIKNPIAIDIKLWYGHFERFYKYGISRLAAIYRGGSTDIPHTYRNDPSWLHLIDFKQHYKDIPIIFDPSHIAGNRHLIQALTQKALLLDVDGLMIETHCNPEMALSDKEQQLPVSGYQHLLQTLTFPQSTKHSVAQNDLANYRLSIDEIDDALIALIGKRTELSKMIAAYKKEHNLPILQVDRWQQVLNETKSKSIQLGIDPDLVIEIFQKLHQYSIDVQEKIIVEND